MERYSKHRPTEYDRAGAFLPSRADWFVVPVIQTRDSGALEQSNFETARKLLADTGVVFGDEDDADEHNAEIHRFGHWGPGWYEIIIVAPGTVAETAATEIEARLERYAILDEDDFSRREYEQASAFWESLPVSHRVEYCQDAGVSIFAARRADLPDSDRIFSRLTQ